MPTITVDYFGFSGTGPTVKEAKQDAGRKIQALHADTWTPVVREWRGHAILIHRDLNGWQYTFIAHPGAPMHLGGSCCSRDDRKTTIASAERHLADLGWEITDPIDAFPVWFGTAENREHAAARREIIERRKWQLQMRHLTNQGIPDETARRIIGRIEPLPEGITMLEVQ